MDLLVLNACTEQRDQILQKIEVPKNMQHSEIWNPIVKGKRRNKRENFDWMSIRTGKVRRKIFVPWKTERYFESFKAFYYQLSPLCRSLQ